MNTPKRTPLGNQPRTYHFPQLSAENGTAADYASGQEQFDAGYESGHQQGYSEGLEQGKQEGLVLGKEEGLTQGIAEGKKIGIAEGQKLYRQTLQPLETLTAQLQQTLNFRLQEQKDLLMQLLKQITDRVLTEELALKPEHLQRMIEESCASLPEPHSHLKIYLHPQDKQKLNAVEFKFDTDWVMLEDKQLKPGACRIETSQSVIQASLPEQVDECLTHIETQLNEAESV